MDKLTTVSASLFMAANVFAIVSLAMPDWIVTDVGGENIGRAIQNNNFHKPESLE